MSTRITLSETVRNLFTNVLASCRIESAFLSKFDPGTGDDSHSLTLRGAPDEPHVRINLQDCANTCGRCRQRFSRADQLRANSITGAQPLNLLQHNDLRIQLCFRLDSLCIANGKTQGLSIEHVDIPAYEAISFRTLDIPEPFAGVWRAHHLFDLTAPANSTSRRNNDSLASNQSAERQLRFNVLIATPPPGQDCEPGVGSSYIFRLKAGDLGTAIGPFGDFHIKPTQREMIYIEGGAGMVPLRAHLSHLLETEQTARKVSFWHGARSKQELFYTEYFNGLQQSRRNFAFHPALSSQLPEDQWPGHMRFIHDVVLEQYLLSHPNPGATEYYLCGAPMMIKACTSMLAEIGVPTERIAYDAF